jgi:hypothetical protein
MFYWQRFIEDVSNGYHITDRTFLCPPCAACSGDNTLHEKNKKAKRITNKRRRHRSKCFVMGLDFI